MDASTEFNKEQTIPDNKITTIINIKFSVALYVITPSVAEKSVAAPKLISNESTVYKGLHRVGI